jgi:hypothetical protein
VSGRCASLAEAGLSWSVQLEAETVTLSMSTRSEFGEALGLAVPSLASHLQVRRPFSVGSV